MELLAEIITSHHIQRPDNPQGIETMHTIKIGGLGLKGWSLNTGEEEQVQLYCFLGTVCLDSIDGYSANIRNPIDTLYCNINALQVFFVYCAP